ncbi:MAG: LOG family protein [Gammaproteobacteria bacterium]
MRQHMKTYIEEGTSGTARSVRIMAEYLSALEAFQRLEHRFMVTVFGSARLLEQADGAQLAEALGRGCVARGYGVITGGSSGVMLAANRGAYEEAQRRHLPVEDYSVGCAVTLPFESGKNAFLGTQADFHYFFVRKFFLVAYSKAFFFLEGGGGTRDELWEVFCLIQTGKMPIHPLVAVGDDASWQTLRADLDHMVGRGTVSTADRNILQFVDTAEAALAIVARFYHHVEHIHYDKGKRTIEFYLRSVLGTHALQALEDRFAPALNGLSWDPERRCLAASQFKFRSYARLYDVVGMINELLRDVKVTEQAIGW